MPSVSAMRPQTSTAADDLDIEKVEAVEGAAVCVVAAGVTLDSVGVVATDFSFVVTGAGDAAGALTTGRCSMMVPAGRTSSHCCALAVTIAPTIADFHKISELAGVQRRARTRSHAIEKRTVLWMA